MFVCSIAVIFLALQNSNGYMTRRSDVPDCTEVGYTVRRTFLEEHNTRRALLAQGGVEIRAGEKLPFAANMRFMGYDCELEKKADKLTTTTCEEIPETPQFNETNTNFALIESRRDNGEVSAPGEAISQWWNQSSKWHNPQKITTKDNSAIPFFLMAQAEGDKVGCSVRPCKKAGSDDSYYSVACVYKKKAEVGSELYKQGTPCSECTDDYTLHKYGLCKKPKQRQ